MSEKIYDWKRFWCPRSSQIDLSDRGYLVDPESAWRQRYNRDLVSLEAIADVPCLVLLGEPGIGKSQGITDLKDYTRAVTGDARQILLLDLHAYGSEDRLIRNLFESRRFTDWLDGTHRLYIFLDSLDEGLLRIEHLASLLVDEFGTEEYCKHVDRLYLRIACRTAVFPQVLENGLKEIWKKEEKEKEQVQIYELAPLRRADAIVAANAHELDTEAFLGEVERQGLVSLAIKPISLKFLINLFQRNNGQFPENQRLVDLYFEGCLALCQEQNPSRRASRRVGRLENEQRLMVASRIAAVTVFANRFAIWTQPNLGNVPDEDVLLEKLCLGSENANSRSFPVTVAAIQEVLDTGLFSSRGSSRMGWAHQTYAEFLAAWYLTQHRLSLRQILDLIIHPDGRVVPQLQETAAWLASIIPAVFQEIVKIDPEVLLQSDISTALESDKAALVESLLKLHNEEKLNYRYLTGVFDNLNHPHIAEQLQPYLSDESKSINARMVAIDIAEACNVQTLQESLVALAIETQHFDWIRVNAAVAVCRIGDATAKLKLKPLAISKPKNETEEELKGCALQALWPDHITVEEVLNTLTQPISKVIGTRYPRFIAQEFEEYLQPSDLPIALTWLHSHLCDLTLSYPFKQLFHSILRKAWNHLDEPEILQKFSRIAFQRLKRHQNILENESFNRKIDFKELLQDDEKRHKLIQCIVSIILKSEQDYEKLVRIRSILLERDFDWLIECLQKYETENSQKIWSKLIFWNWKLKYDLEYVDKVLTVSQINLSLRAEFVNWIEAVELDSLQAQQSQEFYKLDLECQEQDKIAKQKKILDILPKRRILNALYRLEAGNTDFWYDLCCQMTLKPDSTRYGNPFRASLTTLPGWIKSDNATKIRILEAARFYLDRGDPKNQEWLKTDKIYYCALVGYQALRLLQQESPDLLTDLSPEVWKKWTAIILIYPNWNGDRDRESKQALFKLAYQKASNEFIQVLLMEIDKDNREHGAIDINSFFQNCWGEDLENAFLEKVTDESLTDRSLGSILELLLARRVSQTKTLTESFICSPLPKTGQERDKAIAAARALLLYSKDASWSLIWSAIQQDAEFGRQVLEAVSDAVTYEGILEQKLKEEDIVDLYIFLAQQYPEIQRKPQDSAQKVELIGGELKVEDYKVSPEASINEWKDYIPQRLQQRGTPAACQALRKMIRELPELKTKLQRHLLEAEALARRTTWKPPQPEEILELVRDSQKRFVQSGQQLLDVLIDSLQRLEIELQGETPAVRDLWDKVQDKSFKPIDENAFSDYVKRFFDRDLKKRGIIVNREVELRRSYGGNPGERTDIHVDAVIKNPDGNHDSITVIIEVKGCWHSELNTAMKTQLVERYLRDNTCGYGLYLVGWFNCKQWDNQDSRQKKAPKIGIDEARKKFEKQAADLSGSGNLVRAYVLNTALR